MNKKAFTLIELLVVVLIIGILAAVALPQYQTAVNKSRYAGLMPLAKSVKDAEEAQLMATGHYTAKLEDLSVQVPGTIDDNTATTDHVTIELYNGEGDYDFVKATDTRNPANTYVMYFAKSGNFKGEIHCEAEQNNDKAKQLCLSYGPSNAGDPFIGTDSNYKAYVLQGTGEGKGSGRTAWTDWSVDHWSCEGYLCEGYDENGNRIVTWFGCSDSHESCTNKSIWRSLFNEDGEVVGQRGCAESNADASCNGYSSGKDFVYGDDGSRTTLNCSSIQSDGTCTYDSANVMWGGGGGGAGTAEINGKQRGFERHATCSSYDASGCSAYSLMYDQAGISYYRLCDVINGTSCDTWGDWQEGEY